MAGCGLAASGLGVPVVGVWGGPPPLIHTPSFLALGLCSLGLLVYDMIFAEDRLGQLLRYLRYGVLAVALALPQLICFTFAQSLNGRGLAGLFEQLFLSDQELLARGIQPSHYLQFQFNELSEARLQADEQQALEQESQLLAHAEAIREGLGEAAALLDNDTGQSILSALHQAKGALSHIAAYHPEADALLSRLDSSLIELDDINSSLSSLADSIAYNPERQQQVDDRLALIYRLQKKHGVDSVEALLAIRDDLDSRLQSISTLDSRIQTLMEQVDKAFALVQQAADNLSQARSSAGQLLADSILPILHDLGMPEARFAVQLTPTPSYGPMGHDAVAFLFNANRGGDLRDLSKVASGGELSRLMLAIKAAGHPAASPQAHASVPTLIFDEIDTGVSGDISVAVGNIMCRMADRMQVIAITHLPQIAARAAQHLKVYKLVEDSADRTVSHIRQLSPDERLTEVAVMLSSDPPTPAALQTARELMS